MLPNLRKTITDKIYDNNHCSKFLLIGVSVTMSLLLLSPTMVNVVTAQYSGAGDVGPATLEEQITLAKEKISNAQQQGAYGSGTAMFGTNLDNTVLMIIIITIIIGGASASFFIAGGRIGKAARTTVNSSQFKGSNDNEKFKEVSQQVDDLKKVIEDLQRKLMSVS